MIPYLLTYIFMNMCPASGGAPVALEMGYFCETTSKKSNFLLTYWGF